jgi:predicted GNAT family N-acyltransferase
MIHYTGAASEDELLKIIELQRRNLPENLSADEMQREGFVTVKLDLPVLKKISGNYRHIIAKDKDEVAGYCLIMLKEFKNEIPILVPMFDQIDGLQYNNKPLREVGYFVMGQVCIAKEYRGKDLFKGLYHALRDQMQDRFGLVITEVATRNLRSMKAHKKVGFKTLLEYLSPEKEEWALIYWDWK